MSINIVPQKLVFSKLAHRLRMIKSAAFIKIALVQQDIQSQSLVDSQIRKKVKQLAQIFHQIYHVKNAIAIEEGFYQIKQAGWKLIAEAESEEEQDSSYSSIISKIASIQSTNNPISRIQTSDFMPPLETRKLQTENNCNELNLSGHEIERKRIPRMDTYHTLKSDYSRAMKLKKRQIILRKIENIQLCLEYLDSQQKRELTMLYNYFQSL